LRAFVFPNFYLKSSGPFWIWEQWGFSVILAVVEQQLKKCCGKGLFWVGFLFWGLLRLQVASGKVWKCLGKSGKVRKVQESVRKIHGA
jgi:hypothetical protein